MMKKSITILLLTALCMTVFASCDLGNGLVAELLGEIKDAPIGEQIYPTDEYIEVETDILIDIEPVEPPVVEIETTPPYEIGTGEYTGPYTTGDSTGEVEIPEVVCYGLLYVEGVYKNGNSKTEVLLTPEQLENWDGFIHIDESLQCIRIIGYVGYEDYKGTGSLLYYSQISNKKYYDVGFLEPDQEIVDRVAEAGGTKPVVFMYVISTDRLEAGMNTVLLMADPTDVMIEGHVLMEPIDVEMFTTVPDDTTEPAIEEPIID